MKGFSTVRGDNIDFAFWLIFGVDGSLRLTRGKPDTGRNERAMACSALIPKSLFKTPELRASISVEEGSKLAFDIDVRAASEALRQVIGCDIDLRVHPPAESSAYRGLVHAVYDLLQKADVGRIDDLGGGPLETEVRRQIEERCNDVPPPRQGSMIEWVLYEGGGPVHMDDGRSFTIETPQQLWDWWRTTARGPFAPAESGPGDGAATDAQRKSEEG